MTSGVDIQSWHYRASSRTGGRAAGRLAMRRRKRRAVELPLRKGIRLSDVEPVQNSLRTGTGS